MKVLILGGTGTISTANTKQLAHESVDVTIYNRGQTSSDIPGNVQTIIGDRYDYDNFEAQMKQAGCFDCVIDMIGYDPNTDF